MRNRIGPIVLAVLLSAVAALVVAAPAVAQEECATCHEDVVKNFSTAVHGKVFASGKQAAANCASCHLGAQEHAASGGEKKPASLAKGADAPAACLSCHEGKGQSHWQGSAHQLAGLTCASCHDVHHIYGGTPGPKTLSGPRVMWPYEGHVFAPRCHPVMWIALRVRDENSGGCASTAREVAQPR